MSNIAIKVEDLGKLYKIAESRRGYKTARDGLARTATAPFRAVRFALQRPRRRQSNEDTTFWALKNVSFEVKRGEVIGIVGRNGAGKSTLLKILSRITEPTVGGADIHGRVGSLLEVGTGFHTELTGRENIYLNGAILGMRREEIERQFDSIIAFAEVERFIDTPVKHYSSGMYLRLAFAVAAHLEPEILLVDEVLAVGDLSFQKKCLGKMEEVAAHGRTVLFVSHNLGTVKELCQKALVLNGGRVEFYGEVSEGLMHYSQIVTRRDYEHSANVGWNEVRINHHSDGPKPVQTGQPFTIESVLDLPDDFDKARLYCVVDDANGNALIHNFADFEDIEVTRLAAGRYFVKTHMPPLWLMPNLYTLYFKMIGRTEVGQEERYLSERVILNVTDGTKQSAGKIRAIIIPPVKWSISPSNGSLV